MLSIYGTWDHPDVGVIQSLMAEILGGKTFRHARPEVKSGLGGIDLQAHFSSPSPELP